VVHLNQDSSSNDEQVKIDIILDRGRYNNLVSVCKKYKEQHGVELTPREYILMLIDSAISA
jgi:vacuolar-type H+-ATPase subunit C/Vma6